MKDTSYKVHAKTDNDKHLFVVNSSAFITNINDWIQIDSGEGDKYHHAQNNYFDKPLINIDGTHNYKLVDNKPIETTAEEKSAELASFPAPEPSKEQILQSQIDDIFISLVEV